MKKFGWQCHLWMTREFVYNELWSSRKTALINIIIEWLCVLKRDWRKFPASNRLIWWVSNYLSIFGYVIIMVPVWTDYWLFRISGVPVVKCRSTRGSSSKWHVTHRKMSLQIFRLIQTIRNNKKRYKSSSYSYINYIEEINLSHSCKVPPCCLIIHHGIFFLLLFSHQNPFIITYISSFYFTNADNSIEDPLFW